MGGKQLGFKTTALEAVAGVDLQGKTAVVTGGNSGIGVETVRALATAGADVVICSRSLAAGQAVADELAAGGGLRGSLTVKQLDLNDLHSVKAFADDVAASCPAIDLLVLNAGVMAMPKTLTKQGFEMQWGTNHVGHWYLTERLLPKLKAQGTPVRVVAVSSIAHTLAKELPMDDLNWSRRTYGAWGSYGQSKICNVLFAKELSRRMAEEGVPVKAYSLHPGVIKTKLSRHMGIAGSLMRVLFATPGIKQLFSIKSPEQGAATTICACVLPDLEAGVYLSDCQVKEPSKLAQDAEVAKALWVKTEEMVAAALSE